tara:strand:+ start:80 stop:337 length:258 start_codon:yes stop_codon:yes gene_type:complete
MVLVLGKKDSALAIFFTAHAPRTTIMKVNEKGNRPCFIDQAPCTNHSWHQAPLTKHHGEGCKDQVHCTLILGSGIGPPSPFMETM